MTSTRSGGRLSRREALRLGGAAGAAGLTVGGSVLAGAGGAAAQTVTPVAASPADWQHVVSEIERIIQAKGTVSNGVLQIEIDREDLPHVHKHGVPIKPSFQINGTLCFQSLGGESVMFNGDLAFKAEELNPAIDQMTRHGITWQAMHQHLFGLDPMVWFMHMRRRGNAQAVAQACHDVIKATSTPLPQAPPKHPTTPLDTHRLATIIGATPAVGAAGVVTFDLPRREPMKLAGLKISPFLNVFTTVAFQPMGGSKAVVVPDFGLTAHEVEPVAKVMRAQGWELDCLYNQETAEDPQLYFSHQFKTGDAYQLAKEVRHGLEHTGVIIG